MGEFITFPELFIWLPMLAGLLAFFLKGKAAQTWATFASLIVLAVVVVSLFYSDDKQYATYNRVNYYWMKQIGNSFFVGLDSTSRLLALLTAIAFPVIFISTAKNNYKNPSAFYGLMLLSQCGLMGVFVSLDALLFYFFWELALIPVYFLCSKWGGEKRIQATFKFFVYTFAGSLLMLAAILYVYMHTGQRTFEDGTVSDHSFAITSFMNTLFNIKEQGWLFALFFIAFAIKMPVFPFHTWQPDAYDQSPTSVTMVMSAVMVKMGLFAVMRWLIPVLPGASAQYGHIVIILCIIGILYASCIALVQDNIKKLVAYSSIAHIGLMCAAIFTFTDIGVQGAVIQFFSHGINILGMWIVVDILERQTGVKHISQLGGVAQKAPVLTIFLIIIALANIALPLTNAFPGEFMMLGGLFKTNLWYAVTAGLAIILAATYTLRMVRNVFYGEVAPAVQGVKDISFAEKSALAGLVLLIFLFGIMPQPMIDFTKDALKNILAVLPG
ncbi:MAG: NADH-quinone oxidoreductase subunit M [Ferruginibacter sp.]